jgi:hypothetical protein
MLLCYLKDNNAKLATCSEQPGFLTAIEPPLLFVLLFHVQAGAPEYAAALPQRQQGQDAFCTAIEPPLLFFPAVVLCRLVPQSMLLRCLKDSRAKLRYLLPLSLLCSFFLLFYVQAGAPEYAVALPKGQQGQAGALQDTQPPRRNAQRTAGLGTPAAAAAAAAPV